VNVVTCDWDCNKGINNPSGVFSGVTRTIRDQKWSSDSNIVQYVLSCVLCEKGYFYSRVFKNLGNCLICLPQYVKVAYFVLWYWRSVCMFVFVVVEVVFQLSFRYICYFVIIFLMVFISVGFGLFVIGYVYNRTSVLSGFLLQHCL
jgi:hypothetical protein